MEWQQVLAYFASKEFLSFIGGVAVTAVTWGYKEWRDHRTKRDVIHNDVMTLARKNLSSMRDISRLFSDQVSDLRSRPLQSKEMNKAAIQLEDIRRKVIHPLTQQAEIFYIAVKDYEEPGMKQLRRTLHTAKHTEFQITESNKAVMAEFFKLEASSRRLA